MPYAPRASFWAAGLAQIVTRPLNDGDHFCGNEVVAYAPLDRIWAASQAEAADPVDLTAGSVHLLVLRRPDDAAFVSLSAGEAAFVAGLGEGMMLEEAASRTEPGFDLSACFARLLGLGVFAAAQ